MLGLNAVALVFFGCIYVAAYQLCKRPEGRRRKTVRTLCAVLLCGNLLRYCVVYPFVKGVVMLHRCLLRGPHDFADRAKKAAQLGGFFRRNQKQYRKFSAARA